MSRYEPDDLEPSERPMHALLAAVPPQPLPLGFRDQVMRRVARRTTLGWEWIVAAALALPSLAYLAHQLATRGEEFSTALNNVIVTAAAESGEAFFFIDGTTVLALVLVGIASLIAAHAAIATPAHRAVPQR
ncbi:MAG TPA: hypothetical protein VIA63_09670 [Candidatus Limnocylindria bacterium]